MSRERENAWPERVAGAIAQELAAAQPAAVSMRLTPVLREGRSHFQADQHVPAVAEEVIAAGVASIISRRLATQGPDDLHELQQDLTVFALTPYLGPQEALAQTASLGAP